MSNTILEHTNRLIEEMFVLSEPSKSKQSMGTRPTFNKGVGYKAPKNIAERAPTADKAPSATQQQKNNNIKGSN